MVLRDRDDTNGWAGAADGTLEERVYYCQNWRADVSAIVSDAGEMVESCKYSSYGLPFGIPAGDSDGDGDADNDDRNRIISWSSAGYGLRGDLDLDGDVDSADQTLFDNGPSGETLGHGVLSRSDVLNRKGYAGYENDGSLHELYHVRFRVLHSELGRWTRRDPVEYVEGANLALAMRSNPEAMHDAFGLATSGCGGSDGGLVVLPHKFGGCAGPDPGLPDPSWPNNPLSQCRNNLAWCKANDARVQLLLKDLSTCQPGGFSPTIDCCDASGGAGFYYCESDKICVEPNYGKSLQYACAILAHELAHALDECESGTDCGHYKNPDGTINCSGLACTEVNAYNREGECCKGGLRRQDNESYCDCIKRSAEASIGFFPECGDPGQYIGLPFDPNCFDPFESPCPMEAELCVAGT